jgi:hypothetical protein
MNVYICQDHQGHWPVGVGSVVVATDEDEARKLLVKRLAVHGIKQTEPFRLWPINLAEPGAFVLCDGNY